MKLKRFNLPYLTISLLFIILVSYPFESKAIRTVKIATIGQRTPVLDKSQGYQKMVNQMKNFWKRELNQVLPDKPDLIVLQENCDFPWGLTQEEKNAYVEVRKNQMQDFYASIAKLNNCYILFGSRRIDEKGITRNSGILIDRKGMVAGIYDKNFPTVKEMEAGITPSNEVPVFECDFGRLAVAICYDLNFDEHRERYIALKPDIIAFSSAYHGGFVQSIWAYTCRSYFVGAISSIGRNSEIINPLGEIIATSTNYFDYAISEVNLDYKLVHLDYNRPGLKSLKEKYGPKVKISDPGGIGVVIVSSEDDKIGVDQMIKEFNIELLDDYFDRSRDFRKTQLK